MSDVKAVLTEAIEAYFKYLEADGYYPAGCDAEQLADRLLALSGVAVIQLPERVDGAWPVDLADDEFSVWRISMRRERDGVYVNGARISWGSMELNLGGDHARSLAAALLAAAVLSGEGFR